MSLNDGQRKLQKKVWFRAKNSAKNNFCLYVWKPVLPENFSFSVPFSKITHEHSKKIRFQQAMSIKSGAKTKKIRGSQGEKLAKRRNETTAVAQKSTTKIQRHCLQINFFPFLFDTGF